MNAEQTIEENRRLAEENRQLRLKLEKTRTFLSNFSAVLGDLLEAKEKRLVKDKLEEAKI